MANTKLSSLVGLSTPAAGDELYINDISSTDDNAAGSSRKITLTNLFAQADEINTDLVTLTGTQTLTNKTITATTNNVVAKSLHSATTVVGVSTATAPTSGQVLTATSSTVATWQTPALSSKIFALTRDLTAVTGNVATTGIGFIPTSIVFMCDLDTKKSNSMAVVDSTKASTGWYQSDVPQSGVITDAGANACAFAQSSANNYAIAIVASFDADGFTLTWAKTGSPTGTANVMGIAYK